MRILFFVLPLLLARRRRKYPRRVLSIRGSAVHNKVKCPVNVTVDDPVKFLISWNRQAAIKRAEATNATWIFMF